jgi:hypothetical protein
MFLTWFFHGYQWFWLLGNNPLGLVDAFFWGALGLLVLASTIYELKFPKIKGRTVKPWDLKRGLGAVMVFMTMCLLWTLWGSSSVTEFLNLMSVGRNANAASIAGIVAILVFGVVVGGRAWGTTAIADLQPKLAPLGRDLGRAGLTCFALVALLWLDMPAAKGVIGKKAAHIVQVIGSGRLNKRDAGIQLRGYYEKLSVGDRRNGQVWEADLKHPDDWTDLASTAAAHKRTDWQLEDLTPNASVVIKKMPFHVNSHGLHDREYAIPKPAGTIRIGLFGPSSVMAAGVPEDSTLDNMIEDAFNRRYAAQGLHFEVLNFGVDYYSLFQCVEMLRERGALYQVDVAILISHPPDKLAIARNIDVALKSGIPVPYPDLVAMLKRLGIDSTTGSPTINRKLEPEYPKVIGFAVDSFGAVAREIGARPMVVVMRLPTDPPNDEWSAADRARQLGWPVTDLTEVYGNVDEGPFRFAEFDRHFNVAGHRLIADSLGADLLRRGAALRILPGAGTGPSPTTGVQP